MGFFTGRISGVSLPTMTYGSVFTLKLKAHSWSFRTILNVYKQEVVYQIHMNHGVCNVG